MKRTVCLYGLDENDMNDNNISVSHPLHYLIIFKESEVGRQQLVSYRVDLGPVLESYLGPIPVENMINTKTYSHT